MMRHTPPAPGSTAYRGSQKFFVNKGNFVDADEIISL